VGDNGVGKTTLMRLLMGKREPDRAVSILRAPRMRVGYLEQISASPPIARWWMWCWRRRPT
jgi:ATPase subunit of ABC transporter with duplicated ATPase domains